MRLSIVLAAFAVMTCSVTLAEGQTAAPDYGSVPRALWESLKGGVAREQFLSAEMNLFRSAARDGRDLDRTSIEAAATARRAIQRSFAIVQVLRYDLNLDGRITREEVSAVLNGDRSAFGGSRAVQDESRRIDEVMRADKNGDGIIDHEEIRAAVELAEQAGAPRAPTAEWMLTLAGPGGILHAADLMKVLEQSFDLVDLDGDTILSPSEAAAFRDAVAIGMQRPTLLPPPTRGPDEEIHLVGVNEGFLVNGNMRHGDSVLVALDRPGKKVTLLLCSYEPVRWSVTLMPGTELSEIRTFGHAEGSSVLVNDVLHQVLPFGAGDRCPYRPVGQAFHAVVRALPQSTGFARLSSFSGDYKPSSSGFVVDHVSDARELEPNYLVTADRDTLPNYRFPADLRSGPGLYDLSAALVDRGARGDGISSVDVPGHRERYSIMTGGLVRSVPGSLAVGTQIMLSQDLPSFSFPSGIAYDSKRDRVVVVSFGGEGFLYQYDVSKQAWSIISSMENRDVRGLIYEPTDDRLWSQEMRGSVEHLVAFDANGRLVRQIHLDLVKMPGFTDLYDPGNDTPNVRIASIDDKKAVLVATGAANSFRIYLVDLTSQTATLTAFSG